MNVTYPGEDPKKAPNEYPICKEAFGAEHKKSCGLWSPYSKSIWTKMTEKPAGDANA